MENDNLPPPIGKTEIVEVYLYYEFLLLGLVKSDVGLWIATFFKCNRHKDVDEIYNTWLYLFITPDRLKELKDEKIDMHDAFKNPEGQIYFVTFWRNKAPEISVADCLSDEDLPTRGSTLPRPVSKVELEDWFGGGE